ncbi:MAG: 4-hydroxy-tetrahydrodipicolinate synthase, partial [Oceanococcus sp.]
MTYRTQIRGSIVALVTPMQADGAIDYPALDRLIEWHISSGTDAIVSVGTTGESATLEVTEHLEVINRTVQTVNGRIPVLAGTGANATAEARLLTREAFAAGADACLLVTPYYNKPTQEGLFRHYASIAESTEGALILYNVPGRTACDLKPDTVQRLLPFQNIVGIKEASGSLERNQQLLNLDASFAVYTGDDNLACESILMGCRGDVSVTANVAPSKMHA